MIYLEHILSLLIILNTFFIDKNNNIHYHVIVLASQTCLYEQIKIEWAEKLVAWILKSIDIYQRKEIIIAQRISTQFWDTTESL